MPLRAVAVASAGMAIGDSAGDLRAGQRVPRAVRHGGRRHAVHLDRDPVTYLRFRASLSPEQLARLPIRMPAHRVAAWFGIVSLAAIAVTTFFVDGLQYTVLSFLPFLAVISICTRACAEAAEPQA